MRNISCWVCFRKTGTKQKITGEMYVNLNTIMTNSYCKNTILESFSLFLKCDSVSSLCGAIKCIISWQVKCLHWGGHIAVILSCHVEFHAEVKLLVLSGKTWSSSEMLKQSSLKQLLVTNLCEVLEKETKHKRAHWISGNVQLNFTSVTCDASIKMMFLNNCTRRLKSFQRQHETT